MKDAEIHDLVDKKQRECFDRLTETVGKQTELIATETQFIRKSIDRLTKNVEQQNSSIQNLKEWKANVEGEKKGKEGAVDNKNKEKMSKLNIVSIILYAIMTLFVILGYNRNNNQDRDMNVIENKLKDKQDKKPDITTRTYYPTPKQDSIARAWQEKQGEKLLKEIRE